MIYMQQVPIYLRIIESNAALREGRGNPIWVSQDLQSTTRLAESWMLQILDTRMGFPSPSLNVVIDYFSHSCLKMYKICLKRTLDATFLDCLALTFWDVIGELLPEWACLTLLPSVSASALDVWTKTLTLAITSLPKVIELSYCRCVFLVTRPFTWYHNFWPRDLDLEVWPTFEKL